MDERPTITESRARRRIRKAVEAAGYRIEKLTWEPIYAGSEMEGMCGGWTLIVDRNFIPNCYPGNDIYALNVEQLLDQIDRWLSSGIPHE